MELDKVYSYEVVVRKSNATISARHGIYDYLNTAINVMSQYNYGKEQAILERTHRVTGHKSIINISEPYKEIVPHKNDPEEVLFMNKSIKVGDIVTIDPYFPIYTSHCRSGWGHHVDKHYTNRVPLSDNIDRLLGRKSRILSSTPRISNKLLVTKVSYSGITFQSEKLYGGEYSHTLGPHVRHEGGWKESKGDRVYTAITKGKVKFKIHKKDNKMAFIC